MRSGFALLAALATVITSAPAAAGSAVLRAIDEAHAAALIDDGERLIRRVAAVRHAQHHEEPLERCFTDVMAEAYQSLPDLPHFQRGPLADLLAPPDDLAYSVESAAPFPVRVSFADPGLQTKAERILEAAPFLISARSPSGDSGRRSSSPAPSPFASTSWMRVVPLDTRRPISRTPPRPTPMPSRTS